MATTTIARSTIKRVQSFIHARYNETGRVAPLPEIAQRLKIDQEEAALAVKVLVQQGVLFKSAGKVFLNQEASKVAPDEPKAPAIRERFVSADFSRWALSGVQVIMFAVSASAVLTSVYFSRVWLDSFLSPGRSLLLAMTMVIYATVAPQVSIVFFSKRRTGAILIGLGMLSTAVLVTLFSMTSTVAGQYSAFTVTERDSITEDLGEIQRATQWDILTDRLTEERAALEEKRQEIDALQAILSQFNTLEARTEGNGAYYITTRNDLARLNAEAEAMRERIRDLQGQQQELIESGETGYLEETRSERRDFYTWVAPIVQLDPDRVQFWLAVFPAVFVDIIAPLALAVGLFLTRREEESKSIDPS